eukprot:4202828-Pleurochrysis_carterae.AAC.1
MDTTEDAVLRACATGARGFTRWPVLSDVSVCEKRSCEECVTSCANPASAQRSDSLCDARQRHGVVRTAPRTCMACIGGSLAALLSSTEILKEQLHEVVAFAVSGGSTPAAVQGNPIVIGNHSLTEALRLAFSKDFWGKDDLTDEKSHKSFRPIVTLSYYANFELHGLSTWGYHLVNAVVHGINTALAYGLVRAAYGWDPQSTRDAWVAAMLFAVHPVHCEA